MNQYEKDINIARKTLIDAIGYDFCRQHENGAVFSYESVKRGFFCMVGIDLNSDRELCGLTPTVNGLDDWDIYATCYIFDGKVTMDRCRLPKEDNGEE